MYALPEGGVSGYLNFGAGEFKVRGALNSLQGMTRLHAEREGNLIGKGWKRGGSRNKEKNNRFENYPRKSYISYSTDYFYVHIFVL